MKSKHISGAAFLARGRLGCRGCLRGDRRSARSVRGGRGGRLFWAVAASVAAALGIGLPGVAQAQQTYQFSLQYVCVAPSGVNLDSDSNTDGIQINLGAATAQRCTRAEAQVTVTPAIVSGDEVTITLLPGIPQEGAFTDYSDNSAFTQDSDSINLSSRYNLSFAAGDTMKSEILTPRYGTQIARGNQDFELAITSPEIGKYAIPAGSGSVSGTVLAQNLPEVSLTAPSGTVNEGTDAVFTVGLTLANDADLTTTPRLSAPVTFAYTVSGTVSDADYGEGVSTSITCSDATTCTEGRIRIPIERDDVEDPGETLIVTLTEIIFGAGTSSESRAPATTLGQGGDTVPPATATLGDAAPLGFVIEPSASVSINEGTEFSMMQGFQVALSAEPSADVSVTMSLPADSALTLSTDSFVITPPSSYSAPRIVVVAAAEDDDAMDEVVTITLTAASADAGFNGVTEEVVITVADDEVNETVVQFGGADNPRAIEGETLSVPVSVTGQPRPATATARFTISGAVDSSDYVVIEENENVMTYGTRILFNPTSSTVTRFSGTPAALDLPPFSGQIEFTVGQDMRNIRIRTLVNTDGADDTAVEQLRITLTNFAGGAGLPHRVHEDENVRVYSLNQAPGVLLVPASLALTEGGAADTYEFEILTNPYRFVSAVTANQVLTVTPSASPPGKVTLSPSVLMFTRDNWDAAPEISVTPVDDADANDEAVVISHTLTGASGDVRADDYVGLRVGDVAVTIDDDETASAGSVALMPTSVLLNEGGGSLYGVALGSAPTADVVVTLMANPSREQGGDVDIMPARLTFTSANWNNSQNVTINVAEDGDPLGSANETVFISHMVSGSGDYANVNAPVFTITIVDTGAVNTVPSITAPANQSYAVDSAINQLVLPSGTSGDGALTYTLAPLPSGLAFNNNTRTLTGTPTEAGTTLLTYSVIDEDGDSDSATFTVVVVPDTAPMFASGTSVPDQNYIVNQEIMALTLPEAVGGNGDKRYALTGQQPLSLLFDADTRVLTGTPALADTVTAVYTATDVDGDADSLTFTIVVRAAAVAVAGWRSSAPATVTEGATTTGLCVDFTNRAMQGAFTLTVTASADSADAADFDFVGEDAAATVRTFEYQTSAANAIGCHEISTVDDLDIEGSETLTLSLSANAAGNNIQFAPREHVITIEDDDTAGLDFTPDSLTLAEGATMEYDVVLTARPGENVLISDGNETVTFSMGNWNMPQTLTFTAPFDQSTAASRPHPIVHTVTGFAPYAALSASARTLRATINNVSDVVLSRPTLEVAEGGSGNYTVRLASAPTPPTLAYVIVTPTAAPAAGVTFTPSALSFTSANWNDVQAVEVAIDDNDMEGANPDVVISHASRAVGGNGNAIAGSDYHGLAPLDEVTVTVGDDDAVDTAPSFADTQSNLNYFVGQDVTLQLHEATGGNGARSYTLAPLPAGLTFDANTRTLSGAPTTVGTTNLVYTAADSDDNTAASDAATLRFSITVAPAPPPAQPAVTISPNRLALTEDGDSGQFTVSLAAAPTENVTVVIEDESPKSDNGDYLSFTPDIRVPEIGGNTSLVFTPSNWETVRTIEVSANHDGGGEDANIVVRFGISSADARYDSLGEALRIIDITDDDIPGVTMFAGSTTVDGSGDIALAVDEGNSVQYSVVLNAQPNANVRVEVFALAGAPGLEFSHAVDGRPYEAELTFTPDNWSMRQDVRITATEDNIAYGMRTIELTHHAHPDNMTTDPGYEIPNTGLARVTLTVTDNDMPGVTVSSVTPAQINEGGTMVATYNVELNTIPFSPVVVTPSSGNSGPGGASVGGPLSFDENNWNTPQTVTVTASARDGDFADITVAISHAVRGGAYSRVSVAPVSVTVLNTDVGVRVDPQTLRLEEGERGEYDIALATVPAGDVTVTPEVPANSGLESISVVIADSDVGTPLDVITMDDNVATGDRTVTVTHRVESSADSDYDGFAAPPLVVTIIDDDVAGISVSESALTLARTSETYTVSLSSRPSAGAGTVVVTLAAADSRVNLSPSTLTFDDSDWNTPQMVNITATRASADYTTAITHTASGSAEYANVAAVSTSLTVRAHALVVSRSSFNVRTGEDEPYTIALATQPTGDVTVTLMYEGDATDAPTLPGPLVFTDATGATGGWDTPQSITISPQGTTSGAFRIAHVVTGAPEYAALPSLPTVTATVPAPGVILNPTSLAIIEGQTGVYTVTLAAQPTNDNVVITLASERSDTRVSPTSITFNSGNAYMSRTVMVTAGAISTRITHAVAGGGNYAGATAPDLPVTITSPGALDDVNSVILPEVARAIADNQIGAIARRTRAAGKPASGGGYGFSLNGQSTLGGLIATQAKSMADDDLDIKRLLGNTKFELPLTAGASHGSHASTSGAAFWGGGDFRDLGGDGSGVKWDGTLFSAHLGLDTRLRTGVLAGVLVSFDEADIEYKKRDGSGDYDVDMTSVNPYIGWRAGDTEMWATFGIGSGEVEISPDGDGETAATSDLSMRTFGIGANSQLAKRADGGLHLKAEAFVTRVDADESDNKEISDMEVDASRLRVALESRRTRTLASGARLTPSFEFGMRHDSGDGRTGSGAEAGGKIHYRGDGITMEARARVLLGHSGDYNDWGIGGSVQIDPGADGQGLSLTITPGYGNPDTATQALWNDGMLKDNAETETETEVEREAYINFNSGYGVAKESGLLTPYSQMTLSESDDSYRFGFQWKTAGKVDMNLYTNHGHASKDGVWLEGKLKF